MSGLRRKSRNKNARWRAVIQAIINNSRYQEVTSRDTPPLMINTYGMVINNLHTGEIGRGGYFPETSGTSEAQFLTMKANALSYMLTKDPVYKQRAERLGTAALNVMYRKPLANPNDVSTADLCIPALDDPDDEIRRWMPHWLYNVGAPFKAKGPPQPRTGNLASQSDGILLEWVTLTDGIGRVGQKYPDDPNRDPNLLAQVYKCFTYKSRLLWDNVASGLFPPPIGPIDAREYKVEWFITRDGYKGTPDKIEPIKANYSDFPLTDTEVEALMPGLGLTAETAKGYFKISDNGAPMTGVTEVRVNYSTYTGALINTNQPFDAWPMWRDIYDQETLSAFDSLFWGCDTYKTMWEAFKDDDPVGADKWYRAYRHTLKNIDRYGTLLGSDYIWKRNLEVTDPKSETGTDYYSVPDEEYWEDGGDPEWPNVGPGPMPVWDRDPLDGAIRGTLVNPYEPPNHDKRLWNHFAFAANTLYYLTTQDTEISIELWANVPMTFIYELRYEKDYNENILYFHEIDVDGVNWSNVTLKTKDFRRWQYSVWRLGTSYGPLVDAADMNTTFFHEETAIAAKTKDNVATTARALRCHGSISSFFQLQFYPSATNGQTPMQNFANTMPTKPPNVAVCRKEGDIWLKITGTDAGTYYWQPPLDTEVKWYNLQYSDFKVGAIDGPAATANFGVTNMEFVFNRPEGTTPPEGYSIDFYVWKIESKEPENFPLEGEIWVIGVKSYVHTPHVVKIGDNRIRNHKLFSLAYNPGVTPFTVDLVYGSLKQWRGSPFTGYQGGEPWVELMYHDQSNVGLFRGHVKKADNLWAFYKAAQDYYREHYGEHGPFMPVFLWPTWEDIRSDDPAGNFSWEGADPNTGWGGYMARAYYESSKFLNKMVEYGFDEYIPDYAPSIVMDALRHWKTWMENNDDKPITTYIFDEIPNSDPKEWNVYPISDYQEPHAMALVVRAAMLMMRTLGDNISTADNSTLSYIIEHGIDYILSCYNREPFLVNGMECLQGSFGDIIEPDDPDYLTSHDKFTYYGFWNAETIQTLCYYCLWIDQLKLNTPGTGQTVPINPPGPLPLLRGELKTMFDKNYAFMNRFSRSDGDPDTLVNDQYWLTSVNTGTGSNGVGAPHYTGTSEGQFMYALSQAYAGMAVDSVATQQLFTERCRLLLDASVQYLFRPGGYPTDPVNDFMVPHWLFVAKHPVQLLGYFGGPNDGVTLTFPPGTLVENGGVQELPPDRFYAAGDSLPWSFESFYAMHQLTGEQKYLNAADCIARSCRIAGGFYPTSGADGTGSPALTEHKYIPGTIPFTCNASSTGMRPNDGRGVTYAGYQQTIMWVYLREQALVDQVYKFWKDAQDAYVAPERGNYIGPFAPVYHLPHWSVSTPWEVFDWNGIDSPSWGGYEYRGLEQACKGWAWLVDTNGEMTVPADCVTVCTRWMNFLWDWLQYLETLPQDPEAKSFPDSYTDTAPPGNIYQVPHHAALIMRAAIYSKYCYDKLGDISMSTKCQFIIHNCYRMLKYRWVDNGQSIFDGCFPDMQNTADENTWTAHVFWQGEVLYALSLIRLYKVDLNDEGILDNDPPILLSTTPATGDIDISQVADITFTFNEKIYAETGNITLTHNGTPISIPIDDAQVTIDTNNKTLTINPTMAFDLGAIVSVSIPSGVIRDSQMNYWGGTTEPIMFTVSNIAPPPDTFVYGFIGGDLLADFFGSKVGPSGVNGAAFFPQRIVLEAAISGAGITSDKIEVYNATVPGAISSQYTAPGVVFGNYIGDNGAGDKYWWDATDNSQGTACDLALDGLASAITPGKMLNGVIVLITDAMLDIFNKLRGSNGVYGNTFSDNFATQHRLNITGFINHLRTRFNDPDLPVFLVFTPFRGSGVPSGFGSVIFGDERNRINNETGATGLARVNQNGWVDSFNMTDPIWLNGDNIESIIHSAAIWMATMFPPEYL